MHKRMSPHGDYDHMGEAINLVENLKVEKVIFNCGDFNELEQDLRKLETIKTENESLKDYMKLTEKYADYKTIPADVINRDISNYAKTIVINVGSKQDIKEGMTVIGAEGLVGYIISVTDNTAKVQTIVDTASSVSSLMSTTRDPIVCKGTLDGSSTLTGWKRLSKAASFSMNAV